MMWIGTSSYRNTAVSFAGMKRFLFYSFLAASISFVSLGNAWAQQADVQALSDRVARLQRELQDLQRAFYKGEDLPAPQSLPSSVDEGGFGGGQAALFNQKLNQLEAALMTLTAQVEEQGFAVDELSKRLDKLVTDVDRRLLALESGRSSQAPAIGSVGASTGPLLGSAAGEGAAGTTPPPAESGTLGTIPQKDLDAFQGERVEPGAAVDTDSGDEQATLGSDYELPGATPRDKYNHAFSLLRQANYAEAERALRSFVELYPDDPLAGNAQYWLGETYYVRGDYKRAAVTFAEGYKTYPDGVKAADNLLKLGLSLASLDAVDDACATFSELLRRYDNVPASITRRVELERQKLNCS